MIKPRPIFIFPKSIGYSGKEESAYIIINNLIDRGWSPKIIKIPALDRSKLKEPFYFLKYFVTYLNTIIKSICISLVKTPKYINLGQSAVSLFRDGLIYLICVNFHGYRYGIINLHGNDFMYWHKSNYKALFFRLIAKTSRTITILGPNQKNKLLSFGIKPNQLMILDNTCTLRPLNENEVIDKHVDSPNQIQTLFLGNLIESKGYLKYLDALILLVKKLQNTDLKVFSILAGNFLKDNNDNSDKVRKIQTLLDQINNSKNITAVWYNNVDNSEKIVLFKQSHILCFPSTYRTEAQPRVILEAMASGTVVIASKTGEIPYSVEKNCGILLEKVTPKKFAEKLYDTLTNADQRQKTALNGLELFNNRYNINRHIGNWESILKQCS